MLALLTAAPPALAAAGAAPRTVLVLGDSLSAEYGLARNSGWVALLAARLAKEAPQYSVVNASISGDTTSGGLARLDALLKAHRPAIAIVELGANDGLRGLNLEAMRGNLQAIVDRCRAQQARVLLVGMHLPPNYGPDYESKFHAVYETLATHNRLAYAPFLMEGFADRMDWFQADGIHPQARAEGLMLENVWTPLRALLHD